MIRLTQQELDAHKARLARLKAAGTVRTHRCGNPDELAGKESLQSRLEGAKQPKFGANGGKVVPVTLTLPYPPSINHYWVRNRSGGLRINEAGVAYREAVQQAVRAAKVLEMAGKLAVEILACPPDYRRRDIDNLLKATLDALQHAGLYRDDNAIETLKICRGTVVKGGSLLVKVKPA